MKEVPFTPEEFYEITFKADYSIVKDLQSETLYSFKTMIMFTELYANYLKEFKKQ